MDKDGNLWLADALKGVIIFNKEGAEILGIGGRRRGGAREDRLPLDIDFDGEGMGGVVEEGAKG